MRVPLVRPRVADVVFRLYCRPLHPELFDVLACRTVERDGYTLAVRLTPTGHLLFWTDGRVHLTELTATADMELPESGRRLGHRFDGGRTGRIEFTGGVHYTVSSQVEVLARSSSCTSTRSWRPTGRGGGWCSTAAPATGSASRRWAW